MQFQEYLSEDPLPIIEVKEGSPDNSYTLKKGSVVVIPTTTVITLEKEKKTCTISFTTSLKSYQSITKNPTKKHWKNRNE